MSGPKYGGKGRPWHEDFIKYVEHIAGHPIYEGMPDAYSEPDRVQWEAPSNRTSGKFKDTNAKRRAWWVSKANSIGIDPSSANWISRTARIIHPYKVKPCKICGREMELLYVYPNANFLKRTKKLFDLDESFNLDQNETIDSLVSRLHDLCSEKLFSKLPALLKAKGVSIPSDIEENRDAWLKWIRQDYILNEPSTMGPGAMSNAPDRFEGFHSDNRCCRSTHDKGRNKLNMAKYVTDRRVFEYWAEGDWIAADRLMGLVRKNLRDHQCRNGHDGPCDADHIGPISLGFCHRPCFQMLCSACNSGKNNRMSYSDVELLIAHEKAGIKVVSWHSKPIWDKLKDQVENDETALRLSKIMRDNRHNFMAVLKTIEDRKCYNFLGGLLELERADYDVEFKNLDVLDFVTIYTAVDKTKRSTKYAAEQKARRLRIGFESLHKYNFKDNRNAFLIDTPQVSTLIEEMLIEIEAFGYPKNRETLNEMINSAKSQDDWQNIIEYIPSSDDENLIRVKQSFSHVMNEMSDELTKMWSDDRYVRN